nr:reverse transcriptase domain-containing protein [Tanacetum cinerariifolium]
MADQRTMAELLRAPTEGYAEAIVVPPILAEHFEFKHSVINMMTSDQFFGLEKDNPHDHIWAAHRWLEKEPPRSILTWEYLISKFINEFFPPSRTINLRNEISNFQQRFDELFHEAWDRYKDLLRACPHRAVILKKLPEKLGDPRKFLILCGFSELKCKAKDDLEMIPRDSDERLTLNMRHDTSSYSNQPHKESINMINIYDDSCEDYLENLFARNHLSGNPTFSSHPDLTSPEVINPLSSSTTYSSPDHLLEEFADELALITFPPGNDDLPFDIESDLREIEYLLNHDPTKEMDSILEDLVDKCNLADANNNLFDTILEMFTDEHTLDYSSSPLYDDFNDDLAELESDNDDVYDDPFDSKEDKIKESKLLIDELDTPRSSDFLPSLEYYSFLFEDFSEVDALPSTDNEDKVFNPGILIHENLSEVIVQVTPEKNVKKIFISNASLILEDFNPPL